MYYDSIYDKVKSNPRRRSQSATETESLLEQKSKKRKPVLITDNAITNTHKHNTLTSIIDNDEDVTNIKEIEKSDYEKIKNRVQETKTQIIDGEEVITYVVHEKFKPFKHMQISLPICPRKYLRLAKRGELLKHDIPKKYLHKLKPARNTNQFPDHFLHEVRPKKIHIKKMNEIFKQEAEKLREELRKQTLQEKKTVENIIFKVRQDSLTTDLEMSSSSESEDQIVYEEMTPDSGDLTTDSMHNHRLLSKSDSGNDDCVRSLKNLVPSVLETTGNISPEMLNSISEDRRLVDEAFEISKLLK